ncbi:MAG: hypothetical protein ACE5QF_02740 [Thermoplasmata archaeon]
MEEASVPVSLKIVAALMLSLSVFIILINGYLVWLFTGHLFVSFTSIGIIAVVLLASGIVEFISGIGLINLKKWAWTWALYSMLVALVMFVALIVNLSVIGGVIGGLPAAGALAAVGTVVLIGPILIHVFAVVFLFTGEIRSLFPKD